MSALRTALWQFLAGVSVSLGGIYIVWRWSEAIPQDAPAFGVAVAMAETMAFLGMLLFYFDIWAEGDTAPLEAPAERSDVGLQGDGAIRVDIMIATFDEDIALLRPTMMDALRVQVPPNCAVTVHLLDDGRRADVRNLSESLGITYHDRPDNVGYKAGNLRNALFNSSGDFVVICDADTRLFSTFLQNTLGYFRDPSVAWVQTPHWFYDIPERWGWGELTARFPDRLRHRLASALRVMTGKRSAVSDPFLSEPTMFFDVIQRRRNRNGSSFCCGAGSIHRREALMHGAILDVGRDCRRASARVWPIKRNIQDLVAKLSMREARLRPFRYHVSEDILTSIGLHAAGGGRVWRSVFHPQIEARMLSPWSVDAFSVQRLKYAGGTYDIMLRHNPIFTSRMPLQTKLHYAATFWSYLSVLWVPVLLAAPMIALATGVSPVSADPLAFFLHIVPALIANEIALFVGCKGHDFVSGRMMQIALIPLHLRAFVSVLIGRRPSFPTTPKWIGKGRSFGRVGWHLLLLFMMIAAAVWGIVAFTLGLEGFDAELLLANLFWVAWNAIAVSRLVVAAAIRPEGFLPQSATKTTGMATT